MRAHGEAFVLDGTGEVPENEALGKPRLGSSLAAARRPADGSGQGPQRAPTESFRRASASVTSAGGVAPLPR